MPAWCQALGCMLGHRGGSDTISALRALTIRNAWDGRQGSVPWQREAGEPQVTCESRETYWVGLGRTTPGSWRGHPSPLWVYHVHLLQATLFSLTTQCWWMLDMPLISVSCASLHTSDWWLWKFMSQVRPRQVSGTRGPGGGLAETAREAVAKQTLAYRWDKVSVWARNQLCVTCKVQWGGRQKARSRGWRLAYGLGNHTASLWLYPVVQGSYGCLPDPRREERNSASAWSGARFSKSM